MGALNESTPGAQRHVIDRRWFGASDLLLATHQHDPLEPAVLESGASEVGDFMPGQRYFFRSGRDNSSPIGTGPVS